jgi:hypothetical protein
MPGAINPQPKRYDSMNKLLAALIVATFASTFVCTSALAVEGKKVGAEPAAAAASAAHSKGDKAHAKGDKAHTKDEKKVEVKKEDPKK